MDRELQDSIEALQRLGEQRGEREDEICGQLRELRNEVKEVKEAVIGAVATASRSEGMARQAFVDVAELVSSQRDARREVSAGTSEMRSMISRVDASSRRRDAAHDDDTAREAESAAVGRSRSHAALVAALVLDAILALALAAVWVWR